MNEIRVSDVFKWNYSCKSRVVVNQGGTSSGKTYSIMQVLALRAIENPNSVITVAAKSIPALKSGALRDFKDYFLGEIGTNPNLEGWQWILPHFRNFNVTDRIYSLPNGSKIEFKSFEDSEAAKLGKRRFLFINEANQLSYDTYRNLAIRTTEQVFIDYNPTSEFWAHTELIDTEGVTRFISNYTHNPFLSTNVKRDIERAKHKNPTWYRVYGLGKTGQVEGVIFKNCHRVEQFPIDAKAVCYGLDFGFEHDPTALVKLGKLHGNLYGQELIYERGLTNQDIAKRLKQLGIGKGTIIYADAAEPKSIEEIRRLNFHIIAAPKGPDSIRDGISFLKSQNLFITSDSVNWWKEQQKYVWLDGKANTPIDNFNHAWDAARYGSTGIRRERVAYESERATA